jgi:hypothetical protein
MPRWTRDPVWIPERFRQLAPNKSRRTPPTPHEHAKQYVRMYLNRKINARACHELLRQIGSEYPEDTKMLTLMREASGDLFSYLEGNTDEATTRQYLAETLEKLS